MAGGNHLGSAAWMLFASVMAVAALATCLPQDPPAPTLRAPSVPLVVHDPYFSIWSPHDRPTDGPTTHWTGREWPLQATVAIDGVPRRLLGQKPEKAEPLPWLATEVTATRTTFHFADERLTMDLAFVTPALPHDLMVLSRPVTYVVWTAQSRDGQERKLELTFEVTPLVAVDRPDQQVDVVRLVIPGLDVAGVGSQDQAILAARGDDRRIDWGYAFLAQAAGIGKVGNRPDRGLVLRAPLTVRADQVASHVALFAYDDVRAIRYFDADLPAYWRKDPAADAKTLLAQAFAEFPALDQASRAFDREFAATAASLGGKPYAELCALAYRQCLGGNKLCADRNGQPLLFPKENFSNGCIATVDVIYPMAPLFLLLGPDLAKAMLVPVLDYAQSPRWKFPFAPHDLGTYPHATGQVYGGGERDETNQMPVEESANMLLLVAAVCRSEGSPTFARHYWGALERWAAYLEAKGLDPEHQLCTDDFTGHLAHNVNLSAKAILALGAFAALCGQDGKPEAASRWRKVAEDFAAKWVATATDGDGGSRLAFDKPGTWSQKYNLVWDRLLDLRLFPAAVFAGELRQYRKHLQPFGLPLDSRASFTKLDWTLWSACLTGERADFDALLLPLWKQVHETPDRVPLCDWMDTVTAKKLNMIARPVVGGFFLRFLQDEVVWRTWFARGSRVAGGYAPLPLGAVTPVLADARTAPASWRFALATPDAGWPQPGFDDAKWAQGEGGFGTPGTPGAVIGTQWDGPGIWLRRSFRLTALPTDELWLTLHHDEDAEVFLNGVPVAKVGGYTTDYIRVPVPQVARAALQVGDNVLAIHCRQTRGGQFVDAGLVTVRLP